MDPRGFPTSLPAFQVVFPNDAACAKYLEQLRWADGFSCPKCGVVDEPYRPTHRSAVAFQCRHCKAMTSLTAGTVMEKTHMPLTTWFWAAYLMTTQTDGESAMQFQRQLALSRYETAYMMMQKLRAGTVRLDRDPIGTEHPVEIDETLVGGRTRGEGRGRHHKVYVLGAVEVRKRKQGEDRSAEGEKDHDGGKPLKRSIYAGRLRLQVVKDRKARTCERFVRDNVAPGAVVRTDGLCREALEVRRCATLVGTRLILPHSWLPAMMKVGSWKRPGSRGSSSRRFSPAVRQSPTRSSSACASRWSGAVVVPNATRRASAGHTGPGVPPTPR